MNDARTLAALQRQSLYFFVQKAFSKLHPGVEFVRNWHIMAICKALEDVYEGRMTRLLITVPPRHLKSICTAVGFCAWALGRNPALKIITASYGGQLANELSHQFRTVVETDWYQQLFPSMRINPRANRAAEIKTTRQGGRLAVARGGSVTGFGADILIVDDLLKADEGRSDTERENAREFFQGSLLSRLNVRRTGRVIVIQQRLHEDDLAGNLILGGEYTHLNLPSIAAEPGVFNLGFDQVHRREVGDVLFPAREPREELERMRREMGEFAFNAQYLQNPTRPGGGHIRWEWFPRFDDSPPRTAYQQVVQSWDTGMSSAPDSDPSVCLTFGYRNHAWDLLDVFRQRLDFPDLKQAILRQQQHWQADRVVIERASSGISLLQSLRRGPGMRSLYIGFQPRLDKEDRMIGETIKLAEGFVRLPEDASWLAELRHELLGFPNARHDDQVDALSQFLAHISLRATWLEPDRVRERRSMQRRAR